MTCTLGCLYVSFRTNLGKNQFKNDGTTRIDMLGIEFFRNLFIYSVLNRKTAKPWNIKRKKKKRNWHLPSDATATLSRRWIYHNLSHAYMAMFCGVKTKRGWRFSVKRWNICVMPEIETWSINKNIWQITVSFCCFGLVHTQGLTRTERP